MIRLHRSWTNDPEFQNRWQLEAGYDLSAWQVKLKITHLPKCDEPNCWGCNFSELAIGLLCFYAHIGWYRDFPKDDAHVDE